jgi:hypothetical protein
MKEYFRCKKGCISCCPGGRETGGGRGRDVGGDKSSYEGNGGRVAIVYATIGDIYRSFKFNNPEQKKFSDLFAERFEFCLSRPAGELELVEENGKEAIRASPKDLFSIMPISKTPCFNLDKNGCKVHGTISKYLTCVVQPEGYLLSEQTSYGGLEEEKHNVFPCLKGKILDPREESKIRSLNNILTRELEITAELFPYITIAGRDNTKPILFEDLKNTSEAEKLKGELKDIMVSFDKEGNREWGLMKFNIEKLTEMYAEIMGFELGDS